MKKGAGKKSSPLDEIRPESWTQQLTDELLELLWVLESTLTIYTDLDTFVDAVLQGETFAASELPTPTNEERSEPKIRQDDQMRIGQ